MGGRPQNQPVRRDDVDAILLILTGIFEVQVSGLLSGAAFT
jgi:hypothetical protein